MIILEIGFIATFYSLIPINLITKCSGPYAYFIPYVYGTHTPFTIITDL